MDCGEDRLRKGRNGEQIALEYLLQREFRLLHKNWRHHHLEIDLIMEKEGCIHIVEVRSRTFPAVVDPLESVGSRKRRNLINAANNFVLASGIDSDVIFDIVSVLFMEDGSYSVEFYENTFIPFR